MVHIGNIIQDVAKKVGMRPTDLGRKIGRTSQSIYDIYNREHLSTDLLMSIGEALQYDFFQYYRTKENENVVNEDEVKYVSPSKTTISICINNIDEMKFERIFKKINEIIK